MTLEQWAAENDDLIDLNEVRDVELPLWLSLESDWEPAEPGANENKALIFD